MELYSMLYQRIVTDQTLGSLLAVYDNRPAVFYNNPAPADDPKWGSRQYPRIDYFVDMQENPARNSNGFLLLNIWCDASFGAEPEEVEQAVRNLLHATFVMTTDYPYCFAWQRSDSFDGKTEKEQGIHTIGITVIFDIMAFPDQTTLYPDPIKAMNDWSKKVIPNAVVIGRDSFTGWLVPTKQHPAIYWRLASQSIRQKHFTHVWLDIVIEGHVYAKSAADRLSNLALLNTAAALLDHVEMEDKSPLFLRNFTCKPHLDYVVTGQLHAEGTFGLLQPLSHLRGSGYTGEALNDPSIEMSDNPETPGEGS